ncbi:GNAT family N-acetyltransferase [Zobellia uliginosa]|uniref:GNAT family N-acetyltransferase n=1 Tax=Zobellia uliginosa TaxID=143224 RepID=UPI001C070233|nr:GNAT family N-acetyltransferase [Zobellia uliginosa]MBU2948947.1 GNAT family N-acetyltransferase [Zobellia uliginosa]
MKIRKITLNDIQELKKIGIYTFTETFSSQNSKEDMTQYLESQFSIENLKTQLTDPNSDFFFVEHDGKTIGYLKINLGAAQTDIKDENALEIERIYVIKAYQGQKTGQKLFNKALEIAEKLNVDFVWLGVWEKNFKAIQFYKKNGFIEFNRHSFKLGNDLQTDIMMKLNLS